jgi:hypothetical protein
MSAHELLPCGDLPDDASGKGAQPDNQGAPPSGDTPPPSPGDDPEFGGGDVHIHTAPPTSDPLEGVFSELGSLPPKLHPFKAAAHEQLLDDLSSRRVVVLKSFKTRAASAAAYSLMSDHTFDLKKRGLLSPTMEWADNPRGLNIVTTVKSKRVGRHVILVEIERTCSFLDQLWKLGTLQSETVRKTLMDQDSYLILAVNEELWQPETDHPLEPYGISHFSYLLTAANLTDPDAQLAARFENAVRGLKAREDWQEVYDIVRARAVKGLDALEAYLDELEGQPQTAGVMKRPPPSDITVQLVGSDDLAQRTVLFVAAFFPELGEQEFDDLVLRLLGNQLRKFTVERHLIGPDNAVRVVHEACQEPWADVYTRNADDIANTCRLKPIRREDGRAIVEFDEPQLRRDVREQFRARHSRFVRKQAQTLQQSGMLFSALSEAAIDGLLRLFVDRAREDPQASGDAWLVELSGALQARIAGEVQGDTPHEQLNWLIKQALAESQLQHFLFGRLALLIRVMLDEEVLRPMVDRIFAALISANREAALLKVVLSLIERLRFAPHFDPFAWLRRLLDQSGEAVRGQTEQNLLHLAAYNGPRGYEVVETIRGWLPTPDRALDRCSPSNAFALTFPYRLTERQDPFRYDPELLDPWADRLTLFATLPPDPEEPYEDIVRLVDWALDARALQLLEDVRSPAPSPAVAEAARIADLLERWNRALTGARPIAEETDTRLIDAVITVMAEATSASQHELMRRRWAELQTEYRKQATATVDGPIRASWLRREAKTADLSARFSARAQAMRERGEYAT